MSQGPWPESLPRFSPDEIETGRKLFAGPVEFVMGVAKLEQLPPAFPIEIAFAGRSNVGKSSLLNALTGRHSIARTSNTPGRTRELNYFRVGEDLAIVDMPGYGYARAEKKLASAWQRLVKGYLRGRPSLRRAFLLIDARHGVKHNDEETMDLLDETAVNYQLVLTKLDKLKPSEVADAIEEARRAIARRPAAHPVVHATSSETGAGMAELRAEIAGLLKRAATSSVTMKFPL